MLLKQRTANHHNSRLWYTEVYKWRSDHMVNNEYKYHYREFRKAWLQLQLCQPAGHIFDNLERTPSYYPDIDPDPLFRRSVSVALPGKRLVK
ncbi:MAG: hypothetical protein R2744_01450 [Bacteroidales bacterium]